MTEPRCAHNKPAVMKLAPGSYWWCQCGESKDQPWCDGSHKGSDFAPVEVVIEEERNYALCQCKQSAKGAFCDGAHKNIEKA